MRVAIISFGHLDSIFPLSKYLSDFIEVDLYLTFSLDRRQESILNFENVEINEGLLAKIKTADILGDQIIKYVDGRFNVYFFIYHDLKLKTLRNWQLSFELSKILKKYDVIHFNGQNGVLPQLILFLLGKKKIFTIHDFAGHSGEKARFAELMNKWLVKSPWQIIVQNRNTYDSILRNYSSKSKKVNYVPYGNLEIYRCFSGNSKIEGRKNVILFFGRISPYKGVEYLIEAAKIVRKVITDLRVIIAGDGNFNFDISNIKSDKTFEIINRYISNEELVQLISESSAVICPYTDATQSGAVMTAYAFNKPVIASDVGGLSEVIEDGVTGKLVPPENPHKLAEDILYLLKYPDKLNEISKNIAIKQSQSEFSWQNIAQKTIQVYNKTICQ